MDCKRYSNALSGVAAGDLPPVSLERHLAVCDHCRGELALLRRGVALAGQELGRLTTVGPSAGFAKRIRAAVIDDAPAPAPATRWFWPASAAAGVLTISALLFIARQPQPRATSGATPTALAVPVPATNTPTIAVDPASAREFVAESPTRPASSRARRMTPSAEPQILVPPGESRALLAFVALIGPDEPVAEADATAEPAAPLAALTPITIRPIEIVPLDPPAPFGT